MLVTMNQWILIAFFTFTFDFKIFFFRDTVCTDYSGYSNIVYLLNYNQIFVSVIVL